MAAQDAQCCYSATHYWTSAATTCNSASGNQSPQGDQEFDSDAEASCEPLPSPPAQNTSELPVENAISIVDPSMPPIVTGGMITTNKNKGEWSQEDSPIPALSDISLELPSQIVFNGKSPLNIKVPPHVRKIFVGGLHIDTNEETLARYFSEYGEVIDVALKYDAETKRSKGYAFIKFTSPDMVDTIRRAQPHKIDGRVVDTNRAKPNPKHQDVQEYLTPKNTWKRILGSQGCQS